MKKIVLIIISVLMYAGIAFAQDKVPWKCETYKPAGTNCEATVGKLHFWFDTFVDRGRMTIHFTGYDSQSGRQIDIWSKDGKRINKVMATQMVGGGYKFEGRQGLYIFDAFRKNLDGVPPDIKKFVDSLIFDCESDAIMTTCPPPDIP